MLPSVSYPQKEKLVRSELKKQDETKTLVILHNNKKYAERCVFGKKLVKKLARKSDLATKTERTLGF